MPESADQIIINRRKIKTMTKTGKPLIWAHRGASAYAPENTLASFEEAVRQCADGIELDIQQTRDNRLVVIHDETLERTSTGTGWVKDYTLPQLRSFNYSYAKKFPDAPHADIPLMEEVFELIAPTSLTINIELKTGVVFYPDIERKILEMTAHYGMEDRVIYSSFNHYTIQKIHLMDPQTKVGLLYSDGYIDMPAYGRKLGVDALHPAIYNLQYPDYMKQCAAAGLDVNVWTVNKKEYMKMCVQMGVHAIITNYPDKARKIVREVGMEPVNV